MTKSGDTPIHRWLQSGVSRWMDDAVESYFTELARTEHEKPVLVQMEARAAEHGFRLSCGRPAASSNSLLELSAPAG